VEVKVEVGTVVDVEVAMPLIDVGVVVMFAGRPDAMLSPSYPQTQEEDTHQHQQQHSIVDSK